jgi:hypothetical protein
LLSASVQRFVADLVDVTSITPQPEPGWSATNSAGAWTFAAPLPPAGPTLAQQAQASLVVGLAIVSTGTPALNGTYAVDQISQMDVIAIETSINAGKGFPAGATIFNYPDASGVMHAFSESNFTDFAAAVRDYVYALKSAIAGASTTLPAASTTIA